jgi:hypothetical protein
MRRFISAIIQNKKFHLHEPAVRLNSMLEDWKKAMEYRRLGGTGLKVSELCLGCMTFGRETDEKTAGKILDRFIEVGGNFLDTANVYAAGASEEILG